MRVRARVIVACVLFIVFSVVLNAMTMMTHRGID